MIVRIGLHEPLSAVDIAARLLLLLAIVYLLLLLSGK